MSELKYTKEYITDGEKFYWDSNTIDYYVGCQDANGWSVIDIEVYKNVTDKRDWEDEKDMRALYLDLLTEVEDKINKEEYEWIETKLNE